MATDDRKPVLRICPDMRFQGHFTVAPCIQNAPPRPSMGDDSFVLSLVQNELSVTLSFR